MKCGDCKFWEKRKDVKRFPHTGDCINPKIKAHDIGDPPWEKQPKDTLWFFDGSYKDPATTGEDFGCVHFERKE